MGGRRAPVVGRRGFLGLVAALAATACPGVLSAEDEPWRKLIPKVPPPPELPPTPPGAPVDLAAFARVARATADGLSRPDGWVMPSGWYPMLFARDAYWILAAHRDPAVHAAVLARLAREQHESGQTPTALYIDDYRPEGRDRDDESTLLFVLTAFDAFRLGMSTGPLEPALERAAGFLNRRSPGGRYASAPGPYAYWLDTLALAGDAPCLAYVQGIYAVVARGLAEMGLSSDPLAAEAQYRGLFDPALGQLRCYADREGRFGQLRDVSALAGEALSLYYFDRPILEPWQVAATLSAQPRAHYPDGAFLGFKNLTLADGQPLPIAWLADWPANTPGNYQNGASWLLFDVLALCAGLRHGVAGARERLLARLASETRRRPQLHEYLSASPDDPGASDPKRDGYGWNGFVANLLEPLL
jgi:hypothetical protein